MNFKIIANIHYLQQLTLIIKIYLLTISDNKYIYKEFYSNTLLLRKVTIDSILNIDDHYMCVPNLKISPAPSIGG